MMMDTQNIIVFILIAAACVFGARWGFLKVRSFSNKKACDADCGCGHNTKKISS